MMTEIGMEPNRRRHRPKVINHYARQLNLKQSLHSLRLLNYGFVHTLRQVKITPVLTNYWLLLPQIQSDSSINIYARQLFKNLLKQAISGKNQPCSYNKTNMNIFCLKIILRFDDFRDIETESILNDDST